jgi:hypothetical protein
MARLCATLHPKPRQTHHSCYAMPARRPLSLSKPGFSLCPCPKRCLCRCLSCCNLEGRPGRPPDKLRDKRSLFHPLCLPWCLLRASRPSSPCVRCHGGGGARVCFACLRRRLWAPLAAGGFVGAARCPVAFLRDVDVFARPEIQFDGLVKIGHVGGVGVEKTAVEASNFFTMTRPTSGAGL